MDHSGNLYIADGCRIRLVSSGIISTVVGNGLCGYLGDGGPATSAEIGAASGVAVDGSGSIYITNTGILSLGAPDSARFRPG